MIVEKTVVERPLVEGKLFDRSENGKMVRGLAAKDNVNKNWKIWLRSWRLVVRFMFRQFVVFLGLCSDSSLFFSFSSLANCGTNSMVLVLMHWTQYFELWEDKWEDVKKKKLKAQRQISKKMCFEKDCLYD